MPRKPIGDRPMTDAERQARSRAARTAGRPVVRTRRSADHRSRARRWNWQSGILPSRFIEELPDADVERTGTAALARDARMLAATAFTDQFPLVARRTRTIEAWEQPARPARADAMPIGSRVFHQKFGYGTVRAAEDDRLDVAFDKAGEKHVWIASWRRYAASSSQCPMLCHPDFLKQRWRRQVARALRSLPCVRGSAGGTFFAATSHPSKPCRLTYRKLLSRSTKLRCRAPVPRSAYSAITGRALGASKV